MTKQDECEKKKIRKVFCRQFKTIHNNFFFYVSPGRNSIQTTDTIIRFREIVNGEKCADDEKASRIINSKYTNSFHGACIFFRIELITKKKIKK